MAFEKLLEIEQRLGQALLLIHAGCYSCPRIAEEIGVSIPTVSRTISALRSRGYSIEAKRTRDGWKYVLTASGHGLDLKDHGGAR
jgi:biotin operon repressor